MTTDDIRSAIAGIEAEEKAVWQELSKRPRNLHTEEGRRVFDSLFARHVALASQREHLERLLKETLNMGGDLPPRRR